MKQLENQVTNKDIEKELVCFPREGLISSNGVVPYSFIIEDKTGYFLYTGHPTRFLHVVPNAIFISMFACHLSKNKSGKIVQHDEMYLGAHYDDESFTEHVRKYVGQVV